MRNVSRETFARLSRFVELIEKWSPTINLVSKSDILQIWQRHVEDSLALANFAPESASWCDIGSGGGFPGIVVAVVRQDLKMTLIEADKRKAAFLRNASKELELGLTVVADRIESAAPVGADVVSARALAPLDSLVGLAERHGKPSTLYVFPKGNRHRNEIAAAQKVWSFDVDVSPSKIDKTGAVLAIRNITRA